jgi:hypothetical protein
MTPPNPSILRGRRCQHTTDRGQASKWGDVGDRGYVVEEARGEGDNYRSYHRRHRRRSDCGVYREEPTETTTAVFGAIFDAQRGRGIQTQPQDQCFWNYH